MDKYNSCSLGRDQKRLLDFVKKYPGWHYWHDDDNTNRIIKSLSQRGLIEVNEFGQFKLAEEE